MDGDVTVRVTHSTVNYKDGLVLSGKSPIVSRFPMVAGIDLAGIVESSSRPEFRAGDEVLANGYGLSQTHFGGYAEQGARQRRLARQAAGRPLARRGDGDRHGGLHRHALRAGARAPGRRAGAGAVLS